MKFTEEKLDSLVAKIATKVVDMLSQQPVQKEARLVAVTERGDLYTDPEMKHMIYLGKGFDDLTTQDKLIVVKASIHTHYQILRGKTIQGKIMYYELIDSSGIYRSFDISGKLIIEDQNPFCNPTSHYGI